MKDKKTILLIIPLIILIFLVIGATYAYYELNSTGESSTTIVVGGATISANYLISNDITLEDLIPSNDVATYKDIKITYNNTSNEVHKIYLKAKIDYNTFTDTENDGVLYYDIYSGTNHDTLKQEKKLFPTIEYGKSILYEIEIPASSQGNENYRINFYFPKSDKVQNKNGQLILNSSIILEENDSLEYTNNFETDSWGAIAAVINHRDPSVYKVGDEKEIEIDGKSYTVRVANNSTPDECKEADFSETACGFVVEFVDIIEERKMNSTNTSVGGWPASEIRRYANGEFFKKLPSDLQKVIISTKTISGHGTSENSNLISYDMIYLLSTREVFIDEESRPVSTYDTGYDNTRQLDYYKSLGTNSSNYNGTIKKYNEEAKNWWLRSANKPYSDGFLYVRLDGIWTAVRADVTSIYFAPAFRIGDASKNIQDTYEFDYTGTEQTYIASETGIYNIETWGAQGGTYNETYFGGYGGYSRGLVYLEKGTKLYINVGGRGSFKITADTISTVIGGYNGGGTGTSGGDGSYSTGGGSGGGTTHIALGSGLLSSQLSSADKILIVAGGGGGASVNSYESYVHSYSGAAGGGASGNSASGEKTSCTAGNQTSGNTFGMGGNYATYTHGAAGGGGGYYGGTGGGVNAPGCGGSGYIGKATLYNKAMYCYNCTESSDESTKTVSTTCHSETPTSNCAKEGNGYARITYIQ